MRQRDVRCVSEACEVQEVHLERCLGKVHKVLEAIMCMDLECALHADQSRRQRIARAPAASRIGLVCNDGEIEAVRTNLPQKRKR